MPWHVVPEHPSCPAAKPFGVVAGHTGEDDGALEGCHPNRDAANKQLAALYASEEDMTAETNSAARPDYETRSVPFELDQTRDGLTFSGYAAVFNSPTRINSRFEGEFDEVILEGAFRNSLTAKTPVLMFDHGQHPLVGSLPLGVITRAEEDSTGLHIEARLTDNWLVQPVRDAVRDGAISGMSFRFSVSKKGEKWQSRSGDVQLRSIHDFDAVPELGPVVFPAYEPTTASVRSQLDQLTGRLDPRYIGDVPAGASTTLILPPAATAAARARQTTDLTERTARGADGGESSSDGPSSGRRADITARDLARAADIRRLDVRRLRSS